MGVALPATRLEAHTLSPGPGAPWNPSTGRCRRTQPGEIWPPPGSTMPTGMAHCPQWPRRVSGVMPGFVARPRSSWRQYGRSSLTLLERSAAGRLGRPGLVHRPGHLTTGRASSTTKCSTAAGSVKHARPYSIVVHSVSAAASVAGPGRGPFNRRTCLVSTPGSDRRAQTAGQCVCRARPRAGDRP
jgi:hypothetical protein